MPSRKQTFGEELRRLREETEGEVRMQDFADALGVSVVYISDIERNRRNPPSQEKIEKLLKRIGKEGELDRMMQLAVMSRKGVEIPVTNKSSPSAINALVSLARRVEEGQVSDEQWESILNALKKEK